MHWISVLLCIREKLRDACPKIITQSRFALLFLISVAGHPFGGRGHSRYSGDVFCPGAPLVFVRAAEHQWLNRQTASQKQKSSSLRAVKFVRRKTASID